MHGLSKEYTEAGQLLYMDTYEQGEKISHKEFYESGSIMRDTIYENGKAAWIKEYYDQGVLMRERLIDSGRPTQINEYYENGTVLYRKFFNESGVLIRTEKYDPQGNFLMRITALTDDKDENIYFFNLACLIGLTFMLCCRK